MSKIMDSLKSILGMTAPHSGPNAPKAKVAPKKGSAQLSDPAEQEWSPATPLKTRLPDVIPLQPSMLPQTLYHFSTDQANRFNRSSPEFVMASTLTCAAALIGTCCKIAPKQFDKAWVVSQALWGLNIADPSKNKSGTMNVGVRLLKFAQQTVIDPNNRRRVAQALAEKGDDDKTPVKVPARSIIVQDCTPEALLIHMQENPNGCLVSRDEIYGWMSKMERTENAHERALYTEGFAGNNDIVQKRVTRDTVVVENIFVCVFGCIQPDRIRPLLLGRADGETNDGFFERFQLAIYDNSVSSYTDSQEDLAALNRMRHVFCCLASLYENGTNLTMNFSVQAQNLWNNWASAQCESSQLTDVSDQSVMGKHPSLVAKLSLIFQLMSEAEKTQNYREFIPGAVVELQHLEMAINLSELLMSHSRRIQSLVTEDTELQIGLQLLKNLEKLPHQFDFRTLQRKKWRGLSQPDSCQVALDILKQHGYIKSIRTLGQNGKVLVRYEIHPDHRRK